MNHMPHELPDAITVPLMAVIRDALNTNAGVEQTADAIFHAVTDLYYDPHLYYGISCLHSQHDRCGVAVSGQPNVPGRCRYCNAVCVCPCHVA